MKFKDVVFFNTLKREPLKTAENYHEPKFITNYFSLPRRKSKKQRQLEISPPSVDPDFLIPLHSQSKVRKANSLRNVSSTANGNPNPTNYEHDVAQADQTGQSNLKSQSQIACNNINGNPTFHRFSSLKIKKHRNEYFTAEEKINVVQQRKLSLREFKGANESSHAIEAHSQSEQRILTSSIKTVDREARESSSQQRKPFSNTAPSIEEKGISIRSRDRGFYSNCSNETTQTYFSDQCHSKNNIQADVRTDEYCNYNADRGYLKINNRTSCTVKKPFVTSSHPHRFNNSFGSVINESIEWDFPKSTENLDYDFPKSAENLDYLDKSIENFNNDFIKSTDNFNRDFPISSENRDYDFPKSSDNLGYSLSKRIDNFQVDYRKEQNDCDFYDVPTKSMNSRRKLSEDDFSSLRMNFNYEQQCTSSPRSIESAAMKSPREISPIALVNNADTQEDQFDSVGPMKNWRDKSRQMCHTHKLKSKRLKVRIFFNTCDLYGNLRYIHTFNYWKV